MIWALQYRLTLHRVHTSTMPPSPWNNHFLFFCVSDAFMYVSMSLCHYKNDDKPWTSWKPNIVHFLKCGRRSCIVFSHCIQTVSACLSHTTKSFIQGCHPRSLKFNMCSVSISLVQYSLFIPFEYLIVCARVRGPVSPGMIYPLARHRAMHTVERM